VYDLLWIENYGPLAYYFRTRGAAGTKPTFFKINDVATLAWDEAEQIALNYRKLEDDNIDPLRWREQAKLDASRRSEQQDV
jgi:hypothetical protein